MASQTETAALAIFERLLSAHLEENTTENAKPALTRRLAKQAELLSDFPPVFKPGTLPAGPKSPADTFGT